MNKLWYIRTVEYYSGIKGNELLTHVDEFQKPDSKTYILYDSICMTFKKRQYYRDRK